MDNLTKEVHADFILSKGEGRDRRVPAFLQLLWNFSKAVWRYIRGGRRRVTSFAYMERLEICRPCEYRNEDRCTHRNCGCYLSEKAWWATEKCPIDKWGVATPDQIRPK